MSKDSGSNCVAAPLGDFDLARWEARATEAETLLRSLASRHRLMILCYLLEGERSVGDIGSRLELSQSNLSRHLAVLRDDNLVSTRRDGTVIYYRITSERVQPLMQELYRLFCAP